MTACRRSLEVAAFIRQTFEPVIFTTQFPKTQISIYLQIFQNDGGKKMSAIGTVLLYWLSEVAIGLLQACINAATMALIDAGIPMMDYVCACSAGCIDKEPVLDLNNLEEASDTPELTVAILPRTGKVTLLEVKKKKKVL